MGPMTIGGRHGQEEQRRQARRQEDTDDRAARLTRAERGGQEPVEQVPDNGVQGACAVSRRQERQKEVGQPRVSAISAMIALATVTSTDTMAMIWRVRSASCSSVTAFFSTSAIRAWS